MDWRVLCNHRVHSMMSSDPQLQSQIQSLTEDISGDSFDTWYRNRQIRQNMRDGQPWRHTPASISPPTRHAPHQLLQCHRKTYYTEQNAPKEDAPPNGIFWAGKRIEEDLVLPFLEHVAAKTEPQAYLQNSMWVDSEIETRPGQLRIKGSTDPVICSKQGDPILPTEVKTKQSIDADTGAELDPTTHHRAQLHAYLYGLNQTVTYSLHTGLIIYIDREHHTLVASRLDFDLDFWEDTVLKWATTQTEYRIEETLPPAEPEFDWECRYCSFRKRCGKTDDTGGDRPPEGFLPLTEYPRKQVENALTAEGGATELTPTLAHRYPDLADTYDVSEWTCIACGDSADWDAVAWDGNTAEPPPCETCATNQQFAPMRGMSPAAHPTND